MSVRRCLTLAVFLAYSASGCSPAISTKVQDPASVLRASRQDIISSDQLSPASAQAVRMGGMNQEEIIDQGVDLETRKAFEELATPLEKAYVESEVAIGRAQKIEKKEPQTAVALYLHAADLSLKAMFLPQCQGPFDIRCDSLKVFYSRAVNGILNYLAERKWQEDNLPTFATGVTRSFKLQVNHDSKVEDPRNYDSIKASASIGLEGLQNRHHRYGVGLELTACRKRRDTDEDRYLPRVGVCIPLTALVTFPDTPGNTGETAARLEFFNALTTSEVEFQGHKAPLAADFTAPFASLAEKTGLSDFTGLFSGLRGNEDVLQRTGFYTVEPYTSGKIPLITVHGLFSSPLTWLSVQNDLMGDPVVREHYQIFHYMYPTNLPILVNARTFREKLDELNAFLTAHVPPGQREPGMVVISHSMGGILTKTAVITDSQPLKDFFFGDPKQMDKLPSDVRGELDSYLTFSRKPYIDRVIFIAVPHRGSLIADNWIGTIGRWLMSLPKAILSKSQYLLKEARNVVRPELRSDFDMGDPSSIKSLSPKNPTLRGLSQIPVDSHVPFHSIIGDRGKNDTPNSSDGVVSYSSSHLDNAQSELIVPADHTAHGNPKAVQEIRRILRLHVEQQQAHD